MVRYRRELLDGFHHGWNGSVVNVDLINARRVHRRDGDGEGMFANPLCQYLAPIGFQQLGIAEPSNAVSRVEDHGGGNYGTKERAASNLIYACDQPGACLPGLLFKFSGAVEPLEQPKLRSCLGELSVFAFVS